MPPNDFDQAATVPALSLVDLAGKATRESEADANGQAQTPDYLSGRRMFQPLQWPNYLVAFAILGLALLLQILLTDLPFEPYPSRPAAVQVVLADPAAPFGQAAFSRLPYTALQLRLEADEEPLLIQTYPATSLFSGQADPYFAEQELIPGEYHLRLSFEDDAARVKRVLFDEIVSLMPGQVLRLNYE